MGVPRVSEYDNMQVKDFVLRFCMLIKQLSTVICQKTLKASKDAGVTDFVWEKTGHVISTEVHQYSLFCLDKVNVPFTAPPSRHNFA